MLPCNISRQVGDCMVTGPAGIPSDAATSATIQDSSWRAGASTTDACMLEASPSQTAAHTIDRPPARRRRGPFPRRPDQLPPSLRPLHRLGCARRCRERRDHRHHSWRSPGRVVDAGASRQRQGGARRPGRVARPHRCMRTARPGRPVRQPSATRPSNRSWRRTTPTARRPTRRGRPTTAGAW